TSGGHTRSMCSQVQRTITQQYVKVVASKRLREGGLAAMRAVVQVRNKMIDVRRRDIAGMSSIEEWLASALWLRRPGPRRRHHGHSIAAQLHQQGMDHVSIQFCRRQPA